MLEQPENVEEAKGKLGVMIPGLGAVATTFIAGTMLARKGLRRPIGSLTQMGRIRLGKRTDNRNPLINEFVELASMDDLEFMGWDIFEDSAYDSAKRAGVLKEEDLELVRDELEQIKPRSAVFDKKYVKNLNGPNKKKGTTLMDLAEQLMDDMDRFVEEKHTARNVVVWCGSTEIYQDLKGVHLTLANFEKGLMTNSEYIAPSMIYAYAALKKGFPFIMGAPNISIDTPALRELALKNDVPVAGKDFKTGQTLMKRILAPGFKARMIGIDGWFSTNILGNRDGEVLDDPGSFKTKEVSKLSVLDTILQPGQYEELYGDLYHKVRINYYPPRGDNKESWDNIDIFGWLGYPMQIKVNFLCRDSILAAPVALDLVLFMDLAKRAGMRGVQAWLSFYFKSPMALPNVYAENDLFIQLMKLKNTLRYLKGEKLITHLGNEYYD